MWNKKINRKTLFYILFIQTEKHEYKQNKTFVKVH